MGLRVIFGAPGIQSCSDCQKWMYDDFGKRETRAGRDLPRPKKMSTPCHKCPKGPVPFEKELSLKNWQAFNFYLECKAGRPIPDDPIVHANHALIRWVEDDLDRTSQAATRRSLEVLRIRATIAR